MKLDESLNGGFVGLFGEVVSADCYKMKELDFVPDIIFDLGANVGVFTRFARELFPRAKIISVEPDGMNREVFQEHTKDDNIVLIPKAIGSGTLWKYKNVENGAHEVYMNSGEFFPLEDGVEYNGVMQLDWPMVMPDELINEYLPDGMKSVMKIDIEGNENVIFSHQPSMTALRKIDYICMEIHNAALSGELMPKVRQKTFEALSSFNDTHHCYLSNVNFYARKRT